MKVGAHLDDTKTLVAAWDPALSADANVDRIVGSNLLGLPSQSRARDVMTRALRPRFIAGDGGVMEALRRLQSQPDAFRDACYYELTRIDGLVARFVQTQLNAWWSEGRTSVDTGDVRGWIDKLVADHDLPDWSPNIRERVARGLLAALRDLGRLNGVRSSSRKVIVRPGITVVGFAYVAFRLHQQGVSSRAIIDSPTWSCWLLDRPRVDDLMHLLAARGVVYYAVIGSTLRLDWRHHSLDEVVDAAI